MADSHALKKLKTHAKKFGDEGVMQAGVEVDLSFAQLVELQKFIDNLAAQKQGAWAKKHRLTVETRVKRLLGIEEEEAA